MASEHIVDFRMTSVEYEPVEDSEKGGSDSPALNASSGDTTERMAKVFRESMQATWQYMLAIARAAEETYSAASLKLFLYCTEIAKHSIDAAAAPPKIGTITITFKVQMDDRSKKDARVSVAISEEAQLKTIHELSRDSTVARRLVNELSIQQIVNALEGLMGDIVRTTLRREPGVLGSDLKLECSRILEFGSLDELKNFVIEREVRAFLDLDTPGQFAYFKKHCNADVESAFARLGEICELLLRRHVIVHARGILSAEYVRRAKKYPTNAIDKGAELGSRIPASWNYVERAWTNTYAVGMILSYLVALQMSREDNGRQHAGDPDTVLIDGAYHAIRNEQYEAAELILRFAEKRTLSTDSDEWMILINLAQTLKWQGKDAECEKILNQRKWSECAAKYRMCVAALRCDWAEFESALHEAWKAGAMGRSEILEWPVFRLFHQCPERDRILTAVFGSLDGWALSDIFASKILDLDTKQTFEQLNEFARQQMSARAKVGAGSTQSHSALTASSDACSEPSLSETISIDADLEFSVGIVPSADNKIPQVAPVEREK